MRRRSFLKAAGTSGLLLLVKPDGIVFARQLEAHTSLEDGFKNPPPSARPHTFYLFMNGHITAEGITLDLEAMQKAGMGGVLNYNAGIAIPKGPVSYFSDEWYKLFKHTLQEAERLGLDYSMHNCPGWSASGGPWITAEMSMQKVTWSECYISGGRKVEINLPEPGRNLDYYRDTYVLAFPSLPAETTAWYENLHKVSTNNGILDRKHITDGKGIDVHPADRKMPGYLLLEFTEPFKMQSIVLGGANISNGAEGIYSVGAVTIEVSDDGMNFKKIGGFDGISLTVTGNTSFEPVTARFLKLNIPAAMRITQLQIYPTDERLNNWLDKANYNLRSATTMMTEPAPFVGKRPRKAKVYQSDIQKDISQSAFIKSSSIIDISENMSAGGVLRWDVPAGDWTILRFGHTSTATTNRAAPANGQGLECDKLNRDAVIMHFDHMFDKMQHILKPLAQKGKAGVEIDSYEVGMQNWTGQLPSVFKKSRGYELVKYLPVLTGRIVDNVDITERFLWDLRRVVADMVAVNYYGEFSALCKKNNLLFYGEPYKLGPFEDMQAGSRMDNVMGEFWARGQRNKHALKLASSIQHVNGKKIVGAESFTGHAAYAKWQQYPYAMKAQGDYMFTKGLNRIIFHTYAHQPHPTVKPGMTMGPFGTHIDRNNTWYEQGGAWIKYLSRCQYLLQQGLFVADLLYYTGEDAPGQELALREHPTPEPPYGYDYDNINTEALLTRVSIRNGLITLPDGMSYRLLILPDNENITLPVLRQLREWVHQGMCLMGSKPTGLSGLADYFSGKAELDKIAGELWGNSVSGAMARSIGKGMVFSSNSLQAVLDQLNIKADFSFSSESADPAINYIHRLADGAHLYMVANRKRRAEKILCTFRVGHYQPELWDASTGKITKALVYNNSNGVIRLPLQLEPSGSVFVVFRSPAPAGFITAIKTVNKTLISTSHFASQKSGRYKNVYNNFTLCAWIKPETDIALSGMNVMRREDIASYAFFPSSGQRLYGNNHVISGATTGRNGVVVYERLDNRLNPVLEVQQPLSGWSHLALVYQKGTPQVYINGKLAATGTPSVYIVHPSANEEYQDVYATYFEGERAGLKVYPKALGITEIRQLVQAVPVLINEYPEVEIADTAKPSLLFWKHGNYHAEYNNSKSVDINVPILPQAFQLNGAWQVLFPKGNGAPDGITLAQLHSLHKHNDDGVRFFSGTATYRKSFKWIGATPGKRIFLDLGNVEVIAEVKLNNKDLGILWKMPFRVDVTDVLTAGQNALEVKVTTLWPNRLIGDERLLAEHQYAAREFEGQQGGGILEMPEWYVKGQPKPGARITFSTWKHYDADSPLLESGLIGPVTIRTAVEHIF